MRTRLCYSTGSRYGSTRFVGSGFFCATGAAGVFGGTVEGMGAISGDFGAGAATGGNMEAGFGGGGVGITGAIGFGG